MNSLNFSEVSFFWIWAKCQARKMTTSSDIHNMTVLNVAFTVQALPGRDDRRPLRPVRRRDAPRPAAGRGMVPMYGSPR